MSQERDKVRFVSSSVALCYDSKHDAVVKVVRAVDDRGREWESYSSSGDGGEDSEYVLITPPDEPSPLSP